jgi:[ribosomal protein S5]-alanine N-acetyltransferase
MQPSNLPLSDLRTQRLRLRPVAEADAAPTAALVSPDVAANLSTWPSPMSIEQALDKVRKSRALVARREAIDLAIVVRESDALIGWIGLAIDEPGVARLGYWLGTQARGRGLMKEAAAAAVPPGAEFLGVTHVKALVLKGNAPSVAVLEAVGFRMTGEEQLFLETARQSVSCFRFDWSAR